MATPATAVVGRRTTLNVSIDQAGNVWLYAPTQQSVNPHGLIWAGLVDPSVMGKFDFPVSQEEGAPQEEPEEPNAAKVEVTKVEASRYGAPKHDAHAKKR